MSFSNNSKLETVKKNSNEPITKSASAFENHIMQCCKAPEWVLRKWLKKVLTRAGFVIIEDNYKTERCAKEPRYETVHNMLAIRGTPSVCLAAHTDVCRDHDEGRNESRYGSYGEHHYWMYDRHDEDISKPKVPRKVEPVIKTVETDGVIRRVIQDRECRLQVGGDDRLGVAIITWIALNTGYDLGLYFPTDEEIGLKSARVCEIPQLKEFDLIAQIDRGNHSDELVIKIAGEILCSYDTAVRLLEIAYDLGMPRAPVHGMSTDVYALKSRGMCKEAVNMTCGYHHSHGSSPNEYIEIEEARNTMKYVAGIVKDYYLKQDLTNPPVFFPQEEKELLEDELDEETEETMTFTNDPEEAEEEETES